MPADDEFAGMNQKEIAAATAEFSPPQPIEDWMATEQYKQVVADAYFETSKGLQQELKLVSVEKGIKPFTEIEARAGLERAAWGHVDCAVSDAYQEYVDMHPYTIGYLTDDFRRIYGKDGM